MLNHMTLRDLWDYAVDHYGAAPALSLFRKETYSFSEAAALIRAVQVWMQKQGIKKGDKVALLSENSPWWGMSYLAATTMGAVIVPIMIDFSVEQIHNILDHSESRVLLASPRGVATTQGHALLDGKTLVLHKGFAPWEGAATMSFAAQDEVLTHVGAPLAPVGEDALPVALQQPEVDEQDLAAILYTSGTTGLSKGVMLSHKNITYNAWSGIKPGRMKPGERTCMLSLLPLAHAYECTLGFILPMLVGAHVVYLGALPSPRVLLPALREVKPHFILVVPLLVEKIYKSSILPKVRDKKLVDWLYERSLGRKLLNRFVLGKALMKTFGGRLRFFGVGGAPLDPVVEQFLNEAHFPLAMGYGLTETAPCIAGYAPYEGRFRSTGTAFPGVELRIADPNEKGEGEVQVRGIPVMKGYYKAPELTAAAFTEDGWFKTGDLAMLDKESGHLYLRGRIKNVIISASGENIYPEEIEAVINRCPYVDDSLVQEDGNSLVARIRFNLDSFKEYVGEHASSEHLAEKKAELFKTIRDFANARLHSHSRLSAIEEEPEPFEKTPSHKIKRYLYQRRKDKDANKDA